MKVATIRELKFVLVAAKDPQWVKEIDEEM